MIVAIAHAVAVFRRVEIVGVDVVSGLVAGALT
jgi:hypothetical protein